MSALGRYAEALGVTAIDDPQALCMLPFAATVEGRPGYLHGGVVAALLELAGHAALRKALPAGHRPPRLATITVDFLRPGHATDSYASGAVVRLGRRIAHVEARAWQADPARPIALARMTLLLERES